MGTRVFVQPSESVRHYVLRLERGDDVHEALTGFAQTHGVLAAWVRAVGSLENCTLVAYDQHRKSLGVARRIYGPTEALSIEGNLSLRDGNSFPRLSACLSREGDNGIEVLGGQLESARAFSLDVHITVFEDLALVRTHDANTGLAVWMHTDTRPTTQNPRASVPYTNPAFTSASSQSPSPSSSSLDPSPVQPPLPPSSPRVTIARGIGASPVTPPSSSSVSAVQKPAANLGDVARQLEAMPARPRVDAEVGGTEEVSPGDILFHPKWEDVEVVRETVSGGYDVRLKTGAVREISLDVFELAPGQPRGGRKVWLLRPRPKR